MPRKINKRRLRLQLTFVYGIMILAVVAIVAVLVLVVQGYRFNRYDGKLEQGGLVQFDSQPSGATVSADNSVLANKTASKIVLSAGNHTVTIGKDGYSTWKKDVVVKPGTVLWLNCKIYRRSKRCAITKQTCNGCDDRRCSPGDKPHDA